MCRPNLINAYTTSILNKLTFTQSSARFLTLSCTQQLVLIFWNKMAAKAERIMCSSCFEVFKVHKPLLYAVFCISVKTSVVGWKAGSSVAYCESCFWEKNWQNKWILKKPTTRTNWTRNCDVPLGITNNIRQTKLKTRLRFFNANYIWSGRHGGLMVSALVSGSSGPVFLGKTLYSHSAPLHPGV